MSIPVTTLAHYLPSRGLLPTAADCDLAIDAGPLSLVSGVPAAHGWTYGCRLDWQAARIVYDRAIATGQQWTPLFATRIDLIADVGAPGPDVHFARDWIRDEDTHDTIDALRLWTDAGYTLLVGGDDRPIAREWLTHFARMGGRTGWSSCYVLPDDAARTLRIQSLGIDLSQSAVRDYLADRLRLHLFALREAIGIPTAGLCVAIKSGMLCTPGYAAVPGELGTGGKPISGPRYLLGGHWGLAQLGGFYRDIFAALPLGSVVTDETPLGLVRGALWGGSIPNAVLGDGAFA